MKKEKKKCIRCGATETKGHWHCAYDASGQKTREDWCSVCAMQNNRDINKEAKRNNYANCTCSVCGLSNLPAWKTATMCLSCWEERNSDEYFRKQRDRSDCWHCHRRFKKQNANPLSNKEWRFTRHWHPLLKEWICSLCHVNSRDYGCFGITISQLEDVEIRCEDCHCLYSKIWTKLGPTLLDRFQDTTLTPDRITCGNCYQVRLKSSLKKVKTGVSANRVFTNKHNNPRRPKELTWQERAGKDKLGDEPYTQTKLLLPYLLRVHGVDHSIDKLIADKAVENELDAMDLEDE
ncbi:hypothetical protein ACN38_g5760 [Penicillium nordicum]|uniref:Uncharacterized protein n=1 Tax=Penicillium nordicum TaxID=229535 RepID=A0A0M8P4I3_9EURO|nr:hypothetical protein ACN38_g5760 [Penicillium nordicum]